MYIITNAAKNLLRNKGRNILMGIILLAIVITSGVSIIINTTTGKIIEDYKNRFGVQISITPDLKKLQERMNSGKTPDIQAVTSDQYQEFAKSKYLRESQLKIEIGSNSDMLKAIDQKEDGGKNVGTAITDGGSGSSSLQVMPMPNLRVIGYNNFDMLEDFSKGLRKITSGKIYQTENECIISEDLAKLNNLKVGDTIKLKKQTQENVEYSLVVSGIYSDLTDEYGNQLIKNNAYFNRRNEILTSFDTVTKIDNSHMAAVTATYILKSPDDLAAFTKEAHDLGLSDDYDVSGDTASYNRIVGPVEGLTKVSITFLVVVLVLGGIILTLLAAITVRERKYEIGVLRAMGMKKEKIGLGFLSEMLIIMLLCVGIGAAVSTVAAQPVSDILLKRQIQIADDQTQSNNGLSVAIAIPLDQTGAPKMPPIDKVKVSLDLVSFEEILGIAIILAVISNLVSIIYITKYEPIKILTERS